MKRSHLPYTPSLVRFVLAIVVSLVSLCVMAQQGQVQDVNAKTGQAASSSTQVPVKANAQEPSTATPAAGPGAGSPTGQQVAPTPKSPQEDDKLKGHSIEAVVIAGSMILVLGLLFVLQLYWSRRLDQTTYLGQVFHDSVLEFERGRLTAPLREQWERGIYLQEAVIKSSPPQMEPDLAELDRHYGWGDLRYAREAIMNQLLRLGERTESGTTNPYLASSVGNLRPPPGLPDNRRPGGREPRPMSNSETTESRETTPAEIEKARQEQALRDEYENKAAAFQLKLEEWAGQVRNEARQKYDNDREKAKKDAETNTGSVIDTTEMSLLRGQGPKFILEFTALIVIIFLAVILGVLGRLGEQQIGTLLAAIAGYVLGKATTSQAPAQASVQVPAPPAARTEDQGRATGKAA